jgi:hypothetical protein
VKPVFCRKARGVDAWQSLGKLRREPRQLFLRRREESLRLEPAEGAEAMTGLRGFRGVEPERSPEVHPDLLELDLLGEARRRWKDAGYLHRPPIEQKCSPDHTGIPSEAPLPESFAEPDGRGLGAESIRGVRQPAEKRMSPEHRRDAGAHGSRVDLFGRLPRRCSEGRPIDQVEPQGL